MDGGKDKEAAIAICYTSVMGKARKDMHGMGEMKDDAPEIGALTFEELEAARMAQEQAEAAHELTAQFQVLIANTLATPQVGDKGFAIVRLAAEFRKRLDALLSGMGKALQGDKAGARHSKQDQDMLQQVHDNAVSLGAMCETMQAGKARGAFMVTKDATGDYRWIGVYSNRYQDLDGEIIPEAAHKEFLSYLDTHPEAAPEWWSWHTDIGRKSRADWWGMSDGFVFVSGKCTAEQAAPYLQDATPRGMSHGFYAVKQGNTIPLYRTFEVSDLRLDKAANPWTSFDVIVKEAGMAFDAAKREYLVGLFGEEKVTELEAGASATAKALEAANVNFKAAQEPAPDAPTTPPAVDVVKELQAALDPLVKALADARAHATEQDAIITALAAEVKALKVGEDARVAEILAPRSLPFARGVSATTATETVIDEKAAEALVPEARYSWLKEIGPLA